MSAIEYFGPGFDLTWEAVCTVDLWGVLEASYELQLGPIVLPFFIVSDLFLLNVALSTS